MLNAEIIAAAMSGEQCDFPALERGEFGRYIVEVVHDDAPENPFTCWDCEPPIFVDRGGRDGADGYGEFLHGVDLPELTREQFIAAWAHLVPEQYYRHGRLFISVRAWFRDCGATDAIPAMEHINELIADEFHNNLHAADQLEYAASVFRAAGIPAGVYPVSGYVQGAYADVLVVLTPEWARTVGADVSDPDAAGRQMRGAANLYGAWAFGDVVGYQILESAAPCETCGATARPSVIDSCHGFYGFNLSDRENPDYSGVYNAIAETLADTLADTVLEGVSS